MPIHPDDRDRYPTDWQSVRRAILDRAGHACECTGECGDEHAGGRCQAPNGVTIVRLTGPHPTTWARMDDERAAAPLYNAGGTVVRVVLTTAHLDHTPEHTPPADDPDHPHWDNLRALCQRCHLLYDRDQHARSRKRPPKNQLALRLES